MLERVFTKLISLFALVYLCSPEVDAFSTPTLAVGSFRPAGRANSQTLNMGYQHVSSMDKTTKKSSWLETVKDTKSSDFTTSNNKLAETHDFIPSFSLWLKENTSNIALSAAIISAAAFALPSVTYAVPALTEVSSLSAPTLTASATTFMDWVSGTGFYQAFSLVFLSEIGDKTFFIAGLLSMKTSRLISFTGSIGALAAMTILSCIIGQIFHAVPSGLAQGLPLDDIAAVAAFTFFGLKTLKEAIDLDPTKGNSGMDEEFADAEEAVETSEAIKQSTFWAQIASTFALVFAAEFGDRSFLATIALSAAQNPFSVAGGAIAAHGVATGIAVLGGGVIAKYVSEKVIGYIGGSLFLAFAITTALGIF